MIIFFNETRLHDTIGKIIKYRWLVNRSASSLVTFESSPWGSQAKRAGKKSKISRRTR